MCIMSTVLNANDGGSGGLQPAPEKVSWDGRSIVGGEMVELSILGEELGSGTELGEVDLMSMVYAKSYPIF